MLVGLDFVVQGRRYRAGAGEMRGEKIKLRRRLESLQRAAAGEARLLECCLDDEEAIRRKREDDRCKVLVVPSCCSTS